MRVILDIKDSGFSPPWEGQENAAKKQTERGKKLNHYVNKLLLRSFSLAY